MRQRDSTGSTNSSLASPRNPRRPVCARYSLPWYQKSFSIRTITTEWAGICPARRQARPSPPLSTPIKDLIQTRCHLHHRHDRKRTLSTVLCRHRHQPTHSRTTFTQLRRIAITNSRSRRISIIIRVLLRQFRILFSRPPMTMVTVQKHPKLHLFFVESVPFGMEQRHPLQMNNYGVPTSSASVAGGYDLPRLGSLNNEFNAPQFPNSSQATALPSTNTTHDFLNENFLNELTSASSQPLDIPLIPPTQHQLDLMQVTSHPPSRSYQPSFRMATGKVLKVCLPF